MKWRMVKLKEVMSLRKGSITIDDSQQYKRCRVQLHRKGIVLRDKVPGSAIRTKKQQVCKSGDFVVAEMDAKFGGYGFIGKELDGAIVSSHYYLYTLDDKKILPLYFSVLISSSTIQTQIKAKGSTNYSSIRAHEVLEFEIPLPEIEDQQRIANYYFAAIDQINFLSEEIESQKRHLSHLRQSLLQEAVSGRLTAAWRKKHGGGESGRELLQRIRREKERLLKEKKIKKEKPLPPIKPEEIPFDVPDSWTWCRLGDLCSHIADIDHSMPKAVSNGVKFLSAKDLVDGGKINFTESIKLISEEDFCRLSRKMAPQRDDIIYSRIGARLGKARLVQTDERFLVSYSCCTIRTLLKNKKFLTEILDSSFTLRQAVGNTTDHSIPDLGLAKIKGFLIPLPPQSEQQEIVCQLDILLGDCDALEAEIRANEARAVMLQQSILRDAFGQDATSATKPKKKSVASHRSELLPIGRDTRKNRYALAVLLTLLEKKKTVSGQLLDGVWTRLASYDNIFNHLDEADKLRFRGMDKKYADFFSTMRVDETIYWRDLLGPTIEQECISRDKSGVYSKARFFDRALSEFASDNLGPLVEFALSAYDRFMQLTSDPEPAKQPQGKRKTAHSIR